MRRASLRGGPSRVPITEWKNIFRNKAERPLLLLFPGCCDDAAASVMRIRKGQARGPFGNAAASARGESTSSAALADESHLLPSPVENSTAVEGAAPPSSWSPALQKRSPIPPVDRPYMNLDEFVSSLARKNCFPDEEMHHKTGESSGLINFSDDQSVDTSLRLAISPHPQRIKGGNVVELPDDGRSQFCTTPTTEGIVSTLKAGKITEAYGESYQATSVLQVPQVPEPTEVEVEAGQLDQTMKSSTESMERRPRRASRSTGRKTVRPAKEQEEDSSDYSSQRTKTRKQKRKRSEHSSTQDESEKKPIKKKPGSSSRSGRPKKLKYMKQENTEELGNQCNRSDGKGWTCPLLAKTGYQLCDHHLDKLRCKPGSRAKYNKSKKKKQGAAATTLS